MAYIPTEVVFDTWGSPKTINSYDLITDLDDAVNDIIDDSQNQNSLVPFINAQLAKLPGYLVYELEEIELSVKASVHDTSRLSQAWAEGTLPGGAGTKSSREWSIVSQTLAAAEVVKATTEADRSKTEADRAERSVLGKNLIVNGDLVLVKLITTKGLY